MTDPSQTLEEVCRLLGELPGVTVLASHAAGHQANLELACHDGSTALVVQRLCEAANVAFEPPLRLRDPDLQGPRQFSVLAGMQAFDPIDCGNLQLLGIHLVWHLHETGAMQTGAANVLLQRWNGAHVGA